VEYGQSKRFLDALADWEAGRPSNGPVEHNLPRMRHLLALLGNPEAAYRSVIVGGTNGKGTTASFLAHLLKANGERVGLYTSPHLHSIRERVQVDGRPIEREVWADAVAQIQSVSYQFEEAGYGAFTKFEALTAIAALQFKKDEVTFGVFEVGLGGRYDATNAWDSEVSVLTSVQLDHTEVLGDCVEAIAEDKLEVTRSGHVLFTPHDHESGVEETVRRVCEAKGVPVRWVDTEGEISCSPEMPEWATRNKGLAVAVARSLVTRVDEILDGAVESFAWPGRFEIVSTSPTVVLDGAHNPAAAESLACTLKSEADGWRFVVGTGRGHDAKGLIEALAPIATEFVFVASDHPRAIPSADLVRLVPGGTPVRQLRSGVEELKKALTADEGKSSTCVTGSLHVVAMAREALGLVEECEGISEDVLLESLRCLELAVDRVGLALQTVSEDGNVVRVDGPGRSQYFLRNKHPFNDYVSARLAEDKAYQYELFLNAGIRVPYTIKLFNPYADERFNRYQEHASVARLIEEIECQISYPLVVKRNLGSFAQGVYLEHNREGLEERLELLFRHSGYLNNILICQSFVAGREYRAVASGENVHLVYEKQGPLTAEAGGDMNPLHRPGGAAVKVTDQDLLKSFHKIAESIGEVLNLGFYAIDAIAGVDGLSVLEVNPNPVCYFYNESNGREDFVGIYERLLRTFVGETSPPDVTVVFGKD
jgi:dihydrofolate synthase/folylpolyglutamate synthase